MQRLRLLLFRDGAYDGLAHDIAAAVDHIGGGIGEDVGGKLSCLAIGVKIHILISGALLGKHNLSLGNCCFIAIQCEGVDTDEGAALLRQFLVQRIQLGKLAYAGIAGGEPEIHHGDGVGGEQLVALHRVAIQVLALKGGELLHTAVVGRVARVAACGYAHIAVHGLLHDLRVLFLQRGQLVFDIADLRGGLLQPLILLVGELLFSGLDGIQQEVAVVFSVLDHGHALVGLHKDLFPQLGIFRQERVLPLQQLLVQGESLLGGFWLAGHGGAVAAHVAHLVIVLRAAGRQGQHHQHGKSQCKNSLHVHFDSSIVVFFVVSFPLPKP